MTLWQAPFVLLGGWLSSRWLTLRLRRWWDGLSGSTTYWEVRTADFLPSGDATEAQMLDDAYQAVPSQVIDDRTVVTVRFDSSDEADRYAEHVSTRADQWTARVEVWRIVGQMKGKLR